MGNLTTLDLSEVPTLLMASSPPGLPSENASLPPPMPSGAGPYPGGALACIVLAVAVVVVGTVVGNVLVVVAVFTSRALRAPQNLFLVSLASADILVATLVMPFSLANEVMGYWYFGPTWCSFYLALDVLFCTSSIMHLCAISLDRYWSVTRAVSYNRKRTPARVKAMISVVWLISLVISSLPLLLTQRAGEAPEVGARRRGEGEGEGEGEREAPKQCLLNNQTWYILSSCLVSFFAPGLIMVLVYCKIYRVAKQRAAAVFVARRASGRRPSCSETCLAGSRAPGSCPEGPGSGYGPVSSALDSRSEACPRRELDDVDLEERSGGVIRTSSSFSSSSLHLPRRAGGREVERGGGEGGAATSLKPPPPCRSLSWAPTDHCSHHLLTPSPLPPRGRRAPPSKARVAQIREKRFTFVLAVVMGAFVLCWFPFFFTYSLHAVCRDRCSIPDTLFSLFFWIGYCNSCLNPVIYTVFNRDFRRAFKKILFQTHTCK